MAARSTALLIGTLLLATIPDPTLAQAPARAAPHGYAAGADGACDVAGSADPDDDVERALAACVNARARFADLFGTAAPAARVELRAEPGYRIGIQYGRAVVRWPTSAAMIRPPGGDAERHAATQWSDVLPHEIAHGLLVLHLFPDGFQRHDGYGTPLPDWFEEAVAIWAEPPASRQQRIAHARALPAAQRDLRAIVEGEHPAMANRSAFAARDGEALPDDAALRAFYPQSVAVLAFVYDAGGSAAVRTLARRLMARQDPYDALLALPGLPGEAAGIEAAWQAFLR